MSRWSNFKKTYNVICINNKNKSKLFILFNMCYNLLKYNITFSDYKKGNYLNIKKEDKRKLLSLKEYNELIYYLDDKDYSIIFLDKILFNQFFAEFIGRSYIDLRVVGLEGFKEFIKDKTHVFAKMINESGGKGVFKIDCRVDDIKKLYNQLLENEQYLVEEEIIQHKKLNEINSSCVNNIRIVTLVVDNKVYIIANVLRLSDGILEVVSSNDIMCSLDNNGNIIRDYACDDWLNIYYKHPVSQFEFKGGKLPYIKEAIEMVKKAALKIPEVRFVGWDVAITEKGPIIIEGNFYPSYGLHQYYLLNDDYNFKEQLEKILDEELEGVL